MPWVDPYSVAMLPKSYFPEPRCYRPVPTSAPSPFSHPFFSSRWARSTSPTASSMTSSPLRQLLSTTFLSANILFALAHRCFHISSFLLIYGPSPLPPPTAPPSASSVVASALYPLKPSTKSTTGITRRGGRVRTQTPRWRNGRGELSLVIEIVDWCSSRRWFWCLLLLGTRSLGGPGRKWTVRRRNFTLRYCAVGLSLKGCCTAARWGCCFDLGKRRVARQVDSGLGFRT